MFRTFRRLFLPNPFDQMLKKTARKGGKKILLGWNRGLGDIALGLYAMVHRIRALGPGAEITFVTRENLRDGFSLLEGVKVIVAPDWKRGQPAVIDGSLKAQYDLVIEKPNPTDWVRWQRGHLTPRLQWDSAHDRLQEKFPCPDGFTYVGVQVAAETHHGPWRNWPLSRWQELFDRLEKQNHIKVLLFGFGKEVQFPNKNIIDLRGETNLFELLSLIKNRCHALVLPDSGIASITYYLDMPFPLRLITLWADEQGILKQRVASPNPQLIHRPLRGEQRDLSTVTVDAVLAELFFSNTACILLAGGQGTRLGFPGPKGAFSIGGKSLFQWLCEKVPPQSPVAVMTSPLNHHETVAFFKKNHFFGREVHFFQQELQPLLDQEKRPLPTKGPDGNGSVFRSFVRSGLADLFAKKGIDLLTVTNIDNPLADPLDADLISRVRAKKADVAVQCIERTPLYPSMGVFVEKEKKIVEYTDLDPSQEHKWAYSGQMAFDLCFFRKMAEVPLPLHWVRKKVENQWIWKGEQFIFDVLPFASRVEAVVAPCEKRYAPVKNADSVALIEKLLRQV
jgi:ADP-heptose:LPS heptosyltransferase